MSISSINNRILSNLNEISKEPNIKSKGNLPSNNKLTFKDIINNEIEKLNNNQIQADELTKGFISGQVEDLHAVLIATEEARLSLELAVQVRNKCVEAYKEINNMQL